MLDSIGCLYSFDRSLIVESAIKLDKNGDKILKISTHNFYKLEVEKMVRLLKGYNATRKIKINKNSGLNLYFKNILTELDINDESLIDSISNIYKSLEHSRKLIFETDFDKAKKINMQGLFLCLYNFKYYKLKDDFELNRYPISGISY